MCGRTVCALAPEDIQTACRFKDKQGKQQKPDWRDPPNGKSYFPSYNIAPGAYTPVLLARDHFNTWETTSSRVIQPMQWGLIPSWHKGSASDKSYETSNCRAESMLDKQTYKAPLQKGRRCVILAEGFYEWKRTKDSKQPYYIYFPQKASHDKNVFSKESKVKGEGQHDTKVKLEGYHETVVKVEGYSVKEEVEDNKNIDIDSIKVKVEDTTCVADAKQKDNLKIEMDPDHTEDNFSSPRLLTMAGVFDVWHPPGDSEPVYSYSVITVESSSAMSWLHHRMPAMLTTDDEIDQWLNFGDVPLNKAVKLIRAVTCIQSHPVSTLVNNSRHNKPECVEEIDPSKPKMTASSNMMMSWLSKARKKEEPPEKKVKVS